MLVFICSLLVYYLLHSLLAANSVKYWLTKKIIPQHYYRLIYNTLAIGLLIPIALQYPQLDKTFLFAFPCWVRWLSYLLFSAGILLLYLALRGYHLAEFLGTYQIRKSQAVSNQALNIDGLNKYVRHPLYFSALVMVWSGFMVTPHFPMFIVATITTFYIVIGATLEERKLFLVFGETYQQYQQKVPMLLPNLFKKYK